MQTLHSDLLAYIQKNILYVEKYPSFCNKYSGKNKCFLELKTNRKQSIPS